jgi:crotonobetainyl-CoA:carnitine CoA-transferase CaiB-like acyl-CoA transferase
MMSDVLDGLRVLDVSEGIAGSYCSKLLADAGADVVTLEPEEGDPLRARGAGGLFAFLNAGKRSICGEWRALAAAADVVVASDRAGAAELRRAHPGQVVVLITPFGSEGPWSGRPANEFLLQAWCGSTGSRGWPTESPLAGGGQIGEFVSAAYAAVAALAAVVRQRQAGEGELVDLSMLECMSISFSYFNSVAVQLEETPGRQARSLDVPSVVAASDGYVTLTVVTPAQYAAFLKLIGREDLLGDEDLATRYGRERRHAEVQAITEAFTRGRTVAEVLGLARELRLPAAPVCHGGTVRQLDHFRERGVWVRSADGRFEQPAVPYTLNRARAATAGPVPSTGQHTGSIQWQPPAERTPSTPARPAPRPLSGVRVLDCTSFWSGPSASLLLAALGAEVIHVEGPDRPDSNRLTVSRTAADGRSPWNLSPHFHALNNSKKSLVVDLKRPAGAEVFKRLLATADVLLENNSPRVLDGFGLGWDVVQRVNPMIVMTRLSGFGLDGPWRDHVAYAFTVESIAGHAWATGHPDNPPATIGGPADPLAGAHAAFATVLALVERSKSGSGVLVDACLAEPALNAAAEQIIESQIGRTAPARYGNRDPRCVPQGVYQCAGDDSWIAVSVMTDGQWRAVRTLVRDAGLDDPALDRRDARWAAHDKIDDAVSAWCAPIAAERAVETLVAAGVPAARVVAPATIGDNPQMRSRGFFEVAESPAAGPLELPLMPFRFASVDRWLVRPAPDFGQHTDELLAELGVDPAALARLRRERVIV